MSNCKCKCKCKRADKCECEKRDKCDKRNIIYVNVNNTHMPQTGRSWKRAFSDLQSALNMANNMGSATIWVAAGNYIPSMIYTPSANIGGAYGNANPSDKTNPGLRTFAIPNDVNIYGGFSGCETELDQRTCEHATILNGMDISWHVVILGD